MITATYTAKSYSPDAVKSRYVRKVGDVYCWFEVSADRYYLRQGKCDAIDLPSAVRSAADANVTAHYVAWPI